MIENSVWSEKHRPEDLDSVIGNTEQVNRMSKWVDDDSVPHLLLHGPAGTGKSSAVIAFCREKYGDEWRQNLIEYNASSDRGIDIVRDEIKEEAARSASSNHQRKVIMLDEIDSMTSDAQAALRRIMEKYSDQTIFALVCNWSNQIIDPLQSRCTPLPFNRLSDEEINELLTRILEKEGIDYEESAVSKIIDYCDGDARRAVQTLQTSVQDGVLTENIIEAVGGQVDAETVEQLISKCFNGQMDEAHEMVVTDILPNVTDYSRFTNTLMKKIQYSDELPDDVRWYAISRVGELERNIMEGANPHTQITSYLSKIPAIRYASIPQYDE
jgi:replication factor C small subunit